MAPAAPKPVLKHADRAVPLAAIAAAKVAGVDLEVQVDPKAAKDAGPVLAITPGQELEGLVSILRFLARSATTPSGIYGRDALSATQIDEWLDFANSLVSGGGLEGACAVANHYLSLRTYLVGYALSVADIACWGQLQGLLQWDKLKRSGSHPHLARWTELVGGVPELAEVLEQHAPKRRRTAGEVNKDAASGRGGGDTGSYNIDLPDAVEGKVVTRFPPEPSGYLHIGHAKALLMNQYIANMYKGKMILRFDDTNPTKEKDEYVESILADVALMGVTYSRLTYTSDYFPQLLEVGEKLIRSGKMYADDTPVEQMREMREERMHGVESKRRSRSVEENLAIWQQMQAGTEEGLTNCMRFKMDMSAPNKALRDPVAYRCNLTPHLRTGTKYKVYPTYDCACPFVDAYEGVTHALRTSEYKDREEQYKWVLRAQQEVWPGLPWVHIWEFSRLSFVHTVLSKRKLTWFVATKRVDGWDDPRMPTVQGILRRGMTLEALKEFIISQGASKNMTLQEWDKVWTINKKQVDGTCARHTAVVSDNRVRLTLTNAPEQPEVVSVPRHKKYPPAGVKATTRSKVILLDQEDAQAVSEDEEVTLMDWGNAIVRRIVRDAAGVVTSMEGELHLEGSVKTTKLKLTWLADMAELVPLTLTDFAHLINKKKVEETDDFEACVNDVTKWETAALGDANMRNLQRGEVIQLERKGYYIVDQPLVRPSKPVVLFAIPDGRTKEKKPVPVTSW
ncbi:hypothetical protein WJX72_004236 [[Myrmecia] bisecta]|uniref:glutamate--tRNA ligase n=1 Tax=[Myrmecia] bisecta TaxID=41462 RepID=A0AAW1R759_9CHLO